MVRFYADHRIKQHAPPCVLVSGLVVSISAMWLYTTGDGLLTLLKEKRVVVTSFVLRLNPFILIMTDWSLYNLPHLEVI